MTDGEDSNRSKYSFSEVLLQARELHVVSNEPERGSAIDIPCGKPEPANWGGDVQ